MWMNYLAAANATRHSDVQMRFMFYALAPLHITRYEATRRLRIDIRARFPRADYFENTMASRVSHEMKNR